MIEIDVDESAAALVSLLEEYMKEDGIWEYAVDFLVSMATDGASGNDGVATIAVLLEVGIIFLSLTDPMMRFLVSSSCLFFAM